METLKDMLKNTQVNPANLGKGELPAGSYSFKIHTREGASSPFKLFIKESEKAAGGRVAELGVFLKPSEDSLDEQYTGVYSRMQLAGVYTKVEEKGELVPRNKPFDTTVLKSSVANFLAAIGMSGVTIGVADVATGTEVDLDTVDASKPIEVYLTVNGEDVMDKINSPVSGKLEYTTFKGKVTPEVKFTR